MFVNPQLVLSTDLHTRSRLSSFWLKAFINFLPDSQELDFCNEVWSCPRNFVGPDVMFLVDPEPTRKVADLTIFFPS